MSYCWLNDPQLFLYAKGTGTGLDDVLLRRCKKPVSSSSLVVPMKSDDFEYVSNVENHLELLGDRFDWDETDYKRLVKYIYERFLLVNCQGLVIAEIYKLNDANEVPIYIRSLDVLPLKPYIPNIRELPIPLRTVKYLEDVNGKAAVMMEEKDSNVITKLTARVENLEAENTRLESKNNTLEAVNKTLDSNVKTLEAENKTLDSNVKTLEGKVTKLTADLVTQMNASTTLQPELKKIYANTKEVWMNDLTNSEWVGIEGLRITSTATFSSINFVDRPGTFTAECYTNIHPRFWYRVEVFVNFESNGKYPAVVLEDMPPNMERARFSREYWNSYKSTDGKTYAIRLIS